MIRYTSPVTTMDAVRKFVKELPINELAIVWLDEGANQFRMRLRSAMVELGVEQYVTRVLNKKEIAVIIIDQNA